MNFELADELKELLKSNQLDKAIEVAEGRLKQLPTTDFHKILNRSILNPAEDLADYINAFCDQATKYYRSKTGTTVDRVRRLNPITYEEEEVEVITNWDDRELKAIYSEMNGFTINPDLWFIDLFAYSFCKDLDDLDWIADFEYSTDNSLSIVGLEDLQGVYKDYMENEKWRNTELEAACEICEFVIILRLQQLFRQAYLSGIRKNHKWTELPLFVTAHDYDLIYNATNH